MKKSVLFLISIAFILSQAAVSQEMSNITIEFEEQSLKSALCELGEVSQYRFIFQDEVSDTLTVVNKKIEDKTPFLILDTLLANTNYSYVIIGNIVVIYRLSEVIQSQESVPFTITGKVLDSAGFPIPGASILIKTSHTVTEHATVTNRDAIFVITVDNPNTYLIILSAGSLPRVVHIKDAELIHLSPCQMSLNQIVVIGCACRVADE